MELFKVELLKLKKMSIFQCAVFIPTITIISSIRFYYFLKKADVTVWQGLGTASSLIFIGMFLPMLIIYTTVMMGKIENLNNGWKQLLVMPIKRERVYLTKYLVVLLIFALALMSYLIQYMAAAYSLGAKGMMPMEMIVNIICVFLTFQPFIILLFFLSNRFNSVVLSLGVGMMFVFSTMLIIQSDYWKYVPWTYPLMISQGGVNIMPLVSISLLIFAVIFTLDIASFRKKDII